MGQTAENNKWYQGKSKIIREYDAQQKAFKSAVAGRGFLLAPGYLNSASMGLELDAKLKLSELNYQIVAEAIERELKQKGLDYDLAYKQARIDFELSKQTLLTNLQKEFADLDYTQSLTKEEIERMAIELEIRSILLITTKTEIQTEMEGLKRELIDTDRLTFDAEKALVDAKTATLNEKLKVIPYIEDIILKETELLAQRSANIGLKESYIEKKEELVEKKGELTTVIAEKADKQAELAEAIKEEVEVQKDRLQVALSKALLKKEAVDADISIIEAKKAVEALRKTLIESRASLQSIQIGNRVSLLGQKAQDIGTISETETSVETAVLNYDVDAASSRRDARQAVSDTAITGDENANKTAVDADVDATQAIALYNANKQKETAEISAAANVTSKLIHLLAD